MLNKENRELHRKLMDKYKDKLVQEVKNPSQEQLAYEEALKGMKKELPRNSSISVVTEIYLQTL